MKKDIPLDAAPAAGRPHELETLTDAISRLRSSGYESDFFATEDGQLGCRSCGCSMNPVDVQVDLTMRFEGTSNPDDEDILFAITSDSGCKGLYSAAYGPAASPNDVGVLRDLRRTP